MINSPNQPTIGPGTEGSAVVRAQVLLDRAHFSCGEIDGNYGGNLEKTVAAFQRSRNLPANGTIGPETWAVLNGDQAPTITPYTINQQDVAGPFLQSIPQDPLAEAKLPGLYYTSPAEELGERFHARPALLQALNPGRDFGKAGEQVLVTNALTTPPGSASVVLVSKSDSSVSVLDVSGRVLAYYSATIGSEHDPLPIGDWKINGVAQHPKFHYNAQYFWDARNPHEKAVLPPGPNSPVGVVWIDLSKPHYGIHGTSEPAKVGHTYSHGCIRLTNWDASELAGMVKPGTPALLRN